MDSETAVFHDLYRYDIGMAMKPTLVHLPPAMIEELDRRRERSGVSRSQMIRDAVSAYVRDADGSLAEQYRMAYAEMPLDHSDEWGNLDAWLDEVRRMRPA